MIAISCVLLLCSPHLSLAISNSADILEETHRFYSIYRQRRLDVTSILNLQANLKIFSGCLVHVINFEGINLPIFNYMAQPLVLSRFDVVFVRFDDGSHTLIRFIVPFEKAQLNKKLTYEDWKRLKVHPYYNLIYRSRPWTCEAYIHLLPPQISEDRSTRVPRQLEKVQRWAVQPSFFYVTTKNAGNFLNMARVPDVLFKNPVIFMDNPEVNFASSMIQTQWRFDILVSHTQYNGMEEWVNGILLQQFVNRPATSTWEIMHWHVKPCCSQVGTKSLWISRLVLFCRQCKMCEPLYPISLVKFRRPWDSISDRNIIERIKTLNSKINDEDVTWKITNFDPFNTSGRFEPLGVLRDDDEDDYTIFFVDHSFHSSQHISTLTEYLLYDVLRNASFHENYVHDTESYTFSSQHCAKYPEDCGCQIHGQNKIRDVVLHPNLYFVQFRSQQPTAHFPLFHRRFSFVSCGHMGVALPFHELLSSYDQSTWVTILLTSLLVIPFAMFSMHVISKITHKRTSSTNRITSVSFLSRYVEISLKYLVEQGPFDDYEGRALNRMLPLRILGSLFLLMGVILSNAYKGENFQKIVSPKQPIGYSTFEDLAAQNYIIYSSPKVIYSTGVSLEEEAVNYTSVLRPGVHCLTIHLNDAGRIFVVSDFYIATGVVTMKELATRFKNCSLSPNLSVKERFISSIISLPAKHEDYFLQDSIVEILKNCSGGKEAVVIIEEKLVAIRYLYNKNRAGFKRPLSFGKDFIEANQIGFRLKGWIPGHVVERLKAVYTSGLISYYQFLLLDTLSTRGPLEDFPERHESNFKPPNMTDSISVIFVVFPLGLVLSLVACLYEVGMAKLNSTVGLHSDLSVLQRLCISLIGACLGVDREQLVTFFKKQPNKTNETNIQHTVSRIVSVRSNAA